MWRAFFIVLAYALLTLGTHGKATASVFCDADVAAVVGLAAQTSGNPHAARPRAMIVLSANDAETISGDVVLVTNTAAYDVLFSKLTVAKAPSGTLFLTPPFLVASANSLDVRFAWVDHVGVNGAAPHACPTNPIDASFETTDVSLPSDPYAIGRRPTILATFKMNLPPLDCSEPYKPAKMTQHPDENTDFRDTSQGLKTKLALRVYLDSEGKVADVQVTRSSGSIIVDAAGKDAVARAKYSPAIFRCVPVVGTVDIDFSYEVH